MMKRNMVMLARRAAALAVVAGTMGAGRLAAQANLTVYATAGVDGAETHIELIGGTARFGGAGLAPEVGLQGYHLGYDAGTENREVWAVTPSAGLSYRMSTGQVGARVGYSFQNEDVVTPVLEGEGGGSGVVASAQGNYWGAGPELQGIVSYNFGSDYVWSQAQALVPVASMGSSGGRLSAGGEAVWQGSTDSGGGNAVQLGPVLKLSTGHNFSVNVGGGWKHFGGGSTRDDTWYARIGAVKYGITLF
ncbi:MAG TPA: hypothetical protein VFJ16_17740 [Longimicrobium sp.]|nr:hypothetical protein [Longimicrobium sp.]